jgi:hypothetical protein
VWLGRHGVGCGAVGGGGWGRRGGGVVALLEV